MIGALKNLLRRKPNEAAAEAAPAEPHDELRVMLDELSSYGEVSIFTIKFPRSGEKWACRLENRFSGGALGSGVVTLRAEGGNACAAAIDVLRQARAVLDALKASDA